MNLIFWRELFVIVFYTAPTVGLLWNYIVTDRSILSDRLSTTCKVICAINRRLESAASHLLHNLTHFMRSHLSTVSIVFANKSIAFCFHISNIGIQVQPKESLQRLVCSWAVHLAHRRVCSPTRGPRGEGNVPGASQLGLVYFPLLSIKHHFLVLIA